MSRRAPVREGLGRRSATEKKYHTAAVLATGKDNRMGGKTAKQYVEIGGKPLIAYALEVFEASSTTDEIIPTTDVGHMKYARTEIVKTYGLKKTSTIEAEDGEGYESIWKALCTLMEREEKERESAVRNRQDGYIFIHNGVRLFVTDEVIERAYRAVCSYNAYVADMPIKDTTKLVNQERMIEPSPDHNMVWQVQTSQVFSVLLAVGTLTRRMKTDCTDIANDAMAMEARTGVKVQTVMGSYVSIKITTPENLFMTEVLRNSVV